MKQNIGTKLGMGLLVAIVTFGATMAGSDDRRTYAVIGAAMAVHTELGHGFL